VREGISTFFKQPLALTGLFFMFMTGVSLLSMVPYLGGLLSLVLVPGATLGIMAASHEAARGRFPLPSILLIAWRVSRQRKRDMLNLGLMYAAGFAILLGLTALLDGGQFAKFYLVGGEMDAQTLQSDNMMLPLGVFTAGSFLLELLFWHAPALVHWGHVPPVKSLFFSWMACWRNKGAFLMFGLSWMALMSCGLLLSGFLSEALGSTLGNGLVMAAGLMALAMFSTSLIFSFRACFGGSLVDVTVDTVH
jgi:hypothetical protein